MFHLTVDALPHDHLIIVGGDKHTKILHMTPAKSFPVLLTVQAVGSNGKAVKDVRVDYTVTHPATFELLGSAPGDRYRRHRVHFG